jgi:general secretion pathway protein H
VKTTARGFTLLEILVVVFIIGLAVAVISVAVGGNSAANLARKEAETFMLQGTYVAEQSILKGETHGLFVDFRPGQDIDSSTQWCYQWRRVRDRQWQDVPELSAHCLPEQLLIEFIIDDRLWEFDPEVEYQEPVIGFFPSGDASGEVEINILANQMQMDDGFEPERFKLEVIGELHWLSEEERAQQEQKGR